MTAKTGSKAVRSAVLIGLALAAFAAALFYHGFVGDIFCLVQLLLWALILLLLWPGAAGKEPYLIPAGSGLVLALMLWWLWVGASFAWATVFFYQLVVFWTLSALPIAFWAYRLTPSGERLWPWLAGGAMAIGLLLAGHATYQFFVHGWEPKSVLLDINSYAAFLTLLLLPAAGRWLAAWPGPRAAQGLAVAEGPLGRWTAPGLLTFSIAVLAFAVALTGSRGVLLALFFGVGLLLVAARRHTVRRARLALLLLIALSVLAGHLATQGKTGTRLLTLLDPQAAGFGRFLIWERTWALIAESPWLGYGLGSFSLIFPSRQHPLDGSAGFMAHNDYLQLWLETGLPGLVLFLAVLATAGVRFMRAARGAHAHCTAWIELAGITAGLAALAAHSFVNFNLYVLPSLLAAGGLLGRFHALSELLTEEAPVRFELTKYLRPPAARLALALLGLVPALYWSYALAGSYVVERAEAHAAAGDYDAADRDLVRAGRWLRGAEGPWVARAALYWEILARAPGLAQAQRLALAKDALDWLEVAERLNPWRHDIPYLRAKLYWRLRDALAASHWPQHVVQGFEQSLSRQPRFYPARLNYALFLLKRGRPEKAYLVLEKGMAYSYVDHERLVPYLELTAALRRRYGDPQGARSLEARITALRAVPPEKRVLTLDQWRPLTLYRLFGGWI